MNQGGTADMIIHSSLTRILSLSGAFLLYVCIQGGNEIFKAGAQR